MDRSKYIIFGVIILIPLLVIVYPLIHDSINKNSTSIITTITLPKGEYVAGKDLDTGYFDIEALNNNVSFNSVPLNKGEYILGEKFEKSEHIIISGSGKIKLTKAKFAPLKKDNGVYKILYNGFYQSGKQLPEGIYELRRQTENTTTQPYVQILSEKGDIVKAYQINSHVTYQIELKKYSVLEVRDILHHNNGNDLLLLKPK